MPSNSNDKGLNATQGGLRFCYACEEPGEINIKSKTQLAKTLVGTNGSPRPLC
jgi:hypothetical protein